MELTYPNIPGLGRFSDYQNLDPSLQIGFITSYIFKLVFFISIGAGLIALLVAGVLYIVSSSKPRFLILAKQMASNAMLGLFILLCAYLLLYTINPQLLSLTLEKPKLDINFVVADSSTPNTITLAQIPFTKKLTEAVDNLSEKVYVNKKGQYYEQINVKGGLKWCLTDGYGGAVTKEGDSIAGLPVVALPAVDPYKTIKEDGCETSSDNKPTTDKYIYRAEIQFRQTAEIVGKAADILNDKVDATGFIIESGLESLLAQCKCGEANMYVDFNDLRNPKCMGGLIKGMPGYEAAEKKGQCAIQCKSCGQEKVNGALVCDLRDVRKIKNAAGVYIYQVCARGIGVGTCNPDVVNSPTDTTVDPCWLPISQATVSVSVPTDTDKIPACNTDITITKINPKQLIKWKTLKILELQTELEVKSRLSSSFLDSVLLVARALDVNRIDFLLSGAREIAFGYDAQAQTEQREREGINVTLLAYTGASENIAYTGASENTQEAILSAIPVADSLKNKGILARIKAWLAPIEAKFLLGLNPFVSALAPPKFSFEAGTAFYVVSDTSGTINPEILAINQAISRDGERFNLFSVLTDLSLEDIEGVFKQCLVAAFGEADYKLNKDQIDRIVKSAMDSGATDHIQAVIGGILEDIAKAMADGAKEAIGEDASLQFITKFFEKCKDEGCGGKDVKEVAKELKANNCGATFKDAVANTCCYCIKNLINDGIPPRFVSDTISNLFTKDLGDRLPLLEKILRKDTMDVLFPPDQPDKHINKFLNQDTIKVYDKILKGALTEPFDKQIPSLGVLLNKPMEKVLPEFVSNINTGFINAIRSTQHFIKKYQEDFFNGLANQFIVNPLKQWAESWFDRAGIGTKNLTIGACYDKLEDGYIYKSNAGNYDFGSITSGEIEKYNDDFKAGKSPQEPGQCVKMTADEINDLFSVGVPKKFVPLFDTDIEGLIIGVEFFGGAFAYAQTICETLGYSWGATYSVKNASKMKSDLRDLKSEDFAFKMPVQTGDKSYACYGTNDGLGDIKGAIETVQDTKKLKTYIAGGLVNYAEKLGTALTQTAMQFALAYGRVYIEDNLVAPLISRWNAVTNFQAGIAKFMKASVKDALPDQISDLLQSNIKKELDDFCSNYKKAKDQKNICKNGDLGYPDDSTEKWYKVSGLVIDLPEGWTVDDKRVIRQDYCVSPKTGDKICQKLEEHLDSSVLDEINYLFCDTRYTDEDSRWGKMCDSFFNSLRMPLGDALSKICYTPDGGEQKCLDIGNWLDKSLAEWLFPEIKNIKELAKASPKEMICGEKLFLDGNTVTPLQTGSLKSVATQCQAVFSNKFGLIPTIDKAMATTMGDLMPWCSFINYGCKAPILSLPCDKKTVGGFMKCVIEQGCNLLNTQISKRPTASECAGNCSCKYTCPNGSIGTNTCPVEQKICKGCSTMAQNSVFYTLLYEGIEHEIGPVDRRNPQLLKLEKEIYAQIFNALPELVADIKAVAVSRQINWNDIIALVPLPNEILTTLFNKDLSGILKIAIRLGISLSEKDTNINKKVTIMDILGKDEFLGATPYNLLKTKICPDIIAGFEKDNPNDTFDDVSGECRDKIRIAPAYTMETTGSCTLAEQIRVISNVPNSESYILCKILENTPQQVAGLDQPLRNYIQPPEYKILFDLLKNELSEGTPYDCRSKGEKYYYENGQAMCCDASLTDGIGRGACYRVGERPAGLNNVLDFMSTEDPIDVLRGLQASMPTPEAGVYSFVDVFNKSGERCLGDRTKISACSSPVPYILTAMGIGITADTSFTKYPETNGDEIVVYNDITIGKIAWPAVNILGSVAGTDENNKDKPATYYFVQPVSGNDLILVYKKPDKTSTAKADFKKVLDFMETRIGTLLSNGMYESKKGKEKTILDYICEEITNDIIQTEGEWPVGDTFCDIELFGTLYLKKFGDMRKMLVELLSQTPTKLMETYIKKPFSLPVTFDCYPKNKNNDCKAGYTLNKNNECCSGAGENGIMDLISANTALGQPILDTLFKSIDLSVFQIGGVDNAEKALFKGAKWSDKKAQWVDASIMKGVAAIQDAVDYGLTDLPMKVISPIAGFFSEAIGGKKATDITGTGCYPKAKNVCNSKDDIERIVTVNGASKAECCTFAKAQACTPRCRAVDPTTEQCNVLLGEDPAPIEKRFVGGISKMCCFAGVDTDGRNTTDLNAIKSCQRCRSVNFGAGANCRKADENGKGEEKPVGDTCCSNEDYTKSAMDMVVVTKDDWIQQSGSCCTTVSQCIANRLSSHLENLAEMMADGYVRIGSLKK